MAPTKDAYIITGIQEDLDPRKDLELREVPVRMEIDDWFNSKDPVILNQQALFFPAFWKFSQMSPEDKLSWYQIAGIHGKPYVAWDEEDVSPEVANQGYCTHNSILFSTWHRPYLMLWEQVIFEMMKKEIDAFDSGDRPALLKAAQSWRFPYWDWALKKPTPEDPNNYDYTIPVVITHREVEVRTPTGAAKVQNAFYQFTMPGDMEMGDARLKDFRITKADSKDDNNNPITVPWDTCKTTTRYPAGGAEINAFRAGEQNNSQIAKSLRDYKWDQVSGLEYTPQIDDPNTKTGNLTASLRDAFYRVLTIQNFEDFATKRAANIGPKKDHSNEKPHAFDSAENIHDNLHVWCGGRGTDADKNGTVIKGHMSSVPVAAFDPLFWLHHCNIDRLIGLWQFLHDDAWFGHPEGRDKDLRNLDEGNFWIKEGHPDQPTDELRPFHKKLENGSVACYTSDDVRNLAPLGYTYPGLEKWKYVTNGQYNKQRHQDALWETMNKSYNSMKSAQEKFELTGNHKQPGHALMSIQPLREKAGITRPVDRMGVDDYVVDVVYEKFALNGKPFTIHVFVGKVPASPPYIYSGQSALVGEVTNFSAQISEEENTSGCGNCRKQHKAKVLSTGKVVLTNALMTRYKQGIEHTPRTDEGTAVLAGWSPEHVIAFAKDNLRWRVTSQGQDIPLSQVPSLKVAFAIGKADHPADDRLPSKFYDYRGAHEVTEGREGGYERKDAFYKHHYETKSRSRL